MSETQRVHLPTGWLVSEYVAGRSTISLACSLGVAHSTVCRNLRAAGVKMRRPWEGIGRHGPLASIRRDVNGYVTAVDRDGKRTKVHRACWEAYNGPIPEGHIIHHGDGDKENNAITNLVCMTNGEHTGLHESLRQATRARDDCGRFTGDIVRAKEE